MKKHLEKIEFPSPSAFHTNAFDLGITPFQAIRNGFSFGLSVLFTLADMDTSLLLQRAEFAQDHRYIRMSAEKEHDGDRYRMALEITKGAFSAPEIRARINIPGSVPWKQALSELEAFETTCLRMGARKKEYSYMGMNYVSARKAGSPASSLKNG